MFCLHTRDISHLTALPVFLELSPLDLHVAWPHSSCQVSTQISPIRGAAFPNTYPLLTFIHHCTNYYLNLYLFDYSFYYLPSHTSVSPWWQTSRKHRSPGHSRGTLITCDSVKSWPWNLMAWSPWEVTSSRIRRVAWPMSYTKIPKSFCRVMPPALTDWVFSLKHWPSGDFTRACNSHNGTEGGTSLSSLKGSEILGRAHSKLRTWVSSGERSARGVGKGAAYFFTLLYAMYLRNFYAVNIFV